MFCLKYESQSIESMAVMTSFMDFGLIVCKTQYLSVISTQGVSRLPGKWYSAVHEQAGHPNPVSCFTTDPVLSTCSGNIIFKLMLGNYFCSEFNGDPWICRIGVRNRQPTGIHWNTQWKLNCFTTSAPSCCWGRSGICVLGLFHELRWWATG